MSKSPGVWTVEWLMINQSAECVKVPRYAECAVVDDKSFTLRFRGYLGKRQTFGRAGNAPRDRCRLGSAQLWSRAERDWHSSVHPLLCGTQL